jgi:hypothetical protein
VLRRPLEPGEYTSGRLRGRLHPPGAAPLDGPYRLVPGQRGRQSWFASLKVELVDRAHWRTRAEARTGVFGWIDWTNRSRLHSTNGYLSPVEWEQQHATASPLRSAMAHNPGVHLPGEVHWTPPTSVDGQPGTPRAQITS